MDLVGDDAGVVAADGGGETGGVETRAMEAGGGETGGVETGGVEGGRGEAGGVEAGGGETGKGGGESGFGEVTRLVSSMAGRKVPEELEMPEVLDVPEVDLVGLVVAESKFATDTTEADEVLESEVPETPEVDLADLADLADLVELVETDSKLEMEMTEADEALVTGDE